MKNDTAIKKLKVGDSMIFGLRSAPIPSSHIKNFKEACKLLGIPPEGSWHDDDLVEADFQKDVNVKVEKGQVWENKSGEKIEIARRWDRYWICKNRFGDEKKLEEKELKKIISEGKYRKKMNLSQRNKLIRTLKPILVENLGGFTAFVVLKFICKLVRR